MWIITGPTLYQKFRTHTYSEQALVQAKGGPGSATLNIRCIYGEYFHAPGLSRRDQR